MTKPRRQHVLGIAALACAALFLVDRFVVSPLRMWHRTRGNEIERLGLEIEKANHLIGLENALGERMAQYRKHQVPSDASEAEHDLLTSLRRWADKDRITIESIRPRHFKERDQPAQLELRIVCRGTIDAVARLIYDLETEPRPIVIRKVDLTAPRNGGSRLGVSLNVQMLLAQPDTLLEEGRP